ncbi:MAG TPA: hypothetical protein DEB40_05710 [Elusimicrobia bacterium]|nr:hypothetical protein [Elusimicrobiota bacterium]HBT61221.1 hypothetical protein [Elusimicrobiota bacterium]
MKGETAILLLLLAAVPARAREFAAGPSRLEASGYLKELWDYSRSPIDGRPFFLNTSRARLTLEAKSSIFRAHVDYDHEVLAGSFFRTAEHRLFGLAEPDAWLDLDSDVDASATSLWRHRLYRGWGGVESEDAALRFGRQRVAWGTGKLWNPTDVLNPYQPAALEREERRGVDALTLRQGLGELSQAELAYAPHKDWIRSAVLTRGKSHWRDCDFSLMGGKVAGSTGSWIAGGDFAGDFAQGSLHGEWSYTDPRSSRTFWRASLGYEYSFGSEPRARWLKDSTALIEYYHNGQGSAHPDGYDRAALLAGRSVALARDYAGATFSKDLHPLLKLEGILIANLGDSSHFLAPSLQYNALPDLYLCAGWQRFGAGRDTEYGRQPNLVFLQAQYFF